MSEVPRREIGFAMAVALVLGNMIGSGVFLLPASLAPYGGVSLIGWVVSAGGSVLLALVFARLARLMPVAGGPYAYTRQAYGDLAGFLVAWGYWISVWSANAALATAFVGYLDPFVPSLVRDPFTAALLAIGLVWLLTIVNIAGIRAAGRVQMLTTVLKIVPLVVVGVAGLFVLRPEHFAVVETSGLPVGRQVMAVMTLTLWAFLGLECATIPAAHVRDPARTIPRATVIGTLLAAVIYIVSTAGVMGVMAPADLAKTTAPFASAGELLFGSVAAAAVAIGAAVSCLGALNGWVLIVGQLPLAVARDGLFPPAFARLSSRGTPATGMIIAGVLSTILIGMNYSRGLVALFTFIILLATLSTLVAYTFCSLAGFLVSARSPAGPGRLSSGAALIALGAFVYSLIAIGGAGADAVYWGFLLLMSGLPVYVWVARRRRPEGST